MRRSPFDRFDFPVLVADIGGTNARFAVVEEGGTGFRDLGRTPTVAHVDPIAAIRDFALPQIEVAPRSAILAVAGAVEGEAVPFTNSDWVLEPRRLVEAFGLSAVVAVNDFEAQALALPALGPDDLVAIGGGAVRPGATKVVIGPGTGLGACLLVHARDTWIPVPGEGGHTTLAPVGAREEAVWHEIARSEGRVTVEHICSGGGLERVHRALLAVDGRAPLDYDAAAVTAAAARGEPIAVETLGIFVSALGRFCGDVALLSLPHGGVHVAGGIPPRILDVLADGRFRAAFEDKAPFSDLLAGIATSVVVHPLPAFVGLAAFARAPGDFAVRLEGRTWRALPGGEIERL